jgi:mono/diheme cytochrome c family protein
MKNIIIVGASILLILAIVPFILIAKARITKSGTPRIHLIQDMDHQPKFKAQSENLLFADRRAMRSQVQGTVEWSAVEPDEVFLSGKENGEFVTVIPTTVDAALMKKGQKNYEIFCAMCHGMAGYGDGIVAVRAERLEEGTWTPPTSFHIDTTREREVGHLYNTITNGIRNMPAYGPQIDPDTRWSIVAYVRALQRSQNARVDDVPQEVRSALR